MEKIDKQPSICVEIESLLELILQKAQSFMSDKKSSDFFDWWVIEIEESKQRKVLTKLSDLELTFKEMDTSKETLNQKIEFIQYILTK